MGNSRLQEHLRHRAAHVDGAGNHQHRLAGSMNPDKLLHRRMDFRLNRRKILIRIILSKHFPIGRNHNHVKSVNLAKFFFISHAGSGHPRLLFKHVEQALISHRGHGPAFLRNRNMLLGFQGLVLTGPELCVPQNPSRPGIQQINFMILNHILPVSLKGNASLQSQVNVANRFKLIRSIQILQTEVSLRTADPLLRQPDIFLLCLKIPSLFQKGHKVIGGFIQI